MTILLVMTITNSIQNLVEVEPGNILREWLLYNNVKEFISINVLENGKINISLFIMFVCVLSLAVLIDFDDILVIELLCLFNLLFH